MNLSYIEASVVSEFSSDQDTLPFVFWSNSDNPRICTCVNQNYTKIDVVHVNDDKNDVGPESKPLILKSILLPYHGIVRKAVISANHQYLAILRSSKHLEIIDVDSGDLVSVLSITLKGSNVVVGFEWTFDQDFLLITSSYVGLYRFSVSRHSFVLQKSVPLRVVWYIYSQTQQLLLVSEGSPSLPLFRLRSHGQQLFQLPSVNIDPTSAAQTNVFVNRVLSKITHHKLALLTVYGQPYVAFIDTISVNHRVLLYSIHRDVVQVQHALRLTEQERGGKQGHYMINVVDNLIIVHALNTRRSYLFDIEVSEEPLAPPIDCSSPEDIDIYQETNQFLPASTIYQSLKSQLIQLRIVYSKLTTLLTLQPRQLVSFLLRRIDDGNDSHRVLVDVVREMIRAGVERGILRRVMEDVVKHDESSAISQSTMMEQIIQPLMEDTSNNLEELTSAVAFYLSALSACSIPMSKAWSHILTELLLKQGNESELLRFLDAGLIHDSVELALELLKVYPNHHETAMRMLSRLDLHEDIVKVLVESNQIMSGLQYAQKHGLLRPATRSPVLVPNMFPTNTVPSTVTKSTDGFSATYFLTKASVAPIAQRKPTFYSVYRFFEDHGYIPSNAVVLFRRRTTRLFASTQNGDASSIWVHGSRNDNSSLDHRLGYVSEEDRSFELEKFVRLFSEWFPSVG